MNQAKVLTDKAIALLEDAVIHVLVNFARKNGRHAYMSAADIGREMGTYEITAEAKSPGRVHRKILDKLEDDDRVECRWNESGTKRDGWRLKKH